MRAFILIIAVVFQVFAGLGMMQLLDNYMEGGKIRYIYWTDEVDSHQPLGDEDSQPPKKHLTDSDDPEDFPDE